MKRSHRFIIYIVGGGVLISWVLPPSGLLTLMLVLGWIFASAYLDAWLFAPVAPTADSPEASLSVLKAGNSQSRSFAKGARPRLTWVMVYGTHDRQDVEALLKILRAEGLNPIMLTERQDVSSDFLYGIRLPEKEVPRASPLVEMFQLRTFKKPS